MKHCSNCGERIGGEQQFCRSCGAELVVEGPKRLISSRVLIYIGLFSTLAGALLVLIGKFADSKTLAFAGAVFALLSFGVMLTGAILSEMPRRRRMAEARPANGQNEQPTLEKADTTNQLPPVSANDHFPVSVTEHTTTKLHFK
jgi:hypothetical protein